MENINKNNFDYETKIDNQKDSIINTTKESVLNTLESKATKELAEIFWLNKNEIIKLTQFETAELSDKNEVNKTEAQLAKMFWKYE